MRNKKSRFGRARATLLNTPDGQKKIEGFFIADLKSEVYMYGPMGRGLKGQRGGKRTRFTYVYKVWLGMTNLCVHSGQSDCMLRKVNHG